MQTKNSYNPDVLSCLANLSSDEVFTPPNIANDMLDLLPAEIWTDKNITFLDPVSKTGVFLREIAKRLMKGLEQEIPDRQERINHIYTKQLFGVAITEITSLMSRRSLYCSKYANGKYSVCTGFSNDEGNIKYRRVDHEWKNKVCAFCGASQQVYDRAGSLETHAYQFIHTKKPEGIFNMRFDVIVGNPPYQLNDSGYGTSAKPIYNKFVEQAIKLNPRYLTMIIPARWYSGGKGLDNFRDKMLHDDRIKKLVDYFDSTETFPGVDISGGVCYFLWDRDHRGMCQVTSKRKGALSQLERSLLHDDEDTFIRFNEAVNILRKVKVLKEPSIIKHVRSRNPFGLVTTTKSDRKYFDNSVKIFSYPESGWISRKEIPKNINWVDEYKVYISYAYGERGSFPYRVLAKPFLGEKNTCCSETYLLVGPYGSKDEAENLMNYINTRFFRFLVLLKKNTQHATRATYSFVPLQDFTENWTDDKLYKKYGIDSDEVDFIKSMVRPMVNEDD